jgi:hypothetical protein
MVVVVQNVNGRIKDTPPIKYFCNGSLIRYKRKNNNENMKYEIYDVGKSIYIYDNFIGKI